MKLKEYKLWQHLRLAPGDSTGEISFGDHDLTSDGELAIDLLSQVDSFEGGLELLWNTATGTSDFLGSGLNGYRPPYGAGKFTITNNHATATRTVRLLRERRAR